MAESARRGEGASLIAKDLIDSEDPKHMLFCREIAFVATHVFFQGYYSNPLMQSKYIRHNYRTEKLSIEHNGFD